MKARHTSRRTRRGHVQTLLLLVNLVALTACGTLQMGIEHTATPTTMTTSTEPIISTATPRPTETVEAPTPTLTSTPVPEATASPLWTEYRSPRYGYGLALPCFWVIYPGTDHPTIMSYDEAFLQTHSIRGQWLNNEWPDRAIKIDVWVSEAIDPSLSLAEAASQSLNAENTYVHAAQEVTIGSRPAVLAELRDRNDASVSYLIPVFRLSPGRLLFFSVLPRQALSSSDVQAILGSLALSPDQEIVIPSVPPEPPVEGREAYIDESAGYCLAYPSTFEVGEVSPGQTGLLGPDLEQGVSPVRAGLTVQVQDLPPDSTLAEQADAFQDQIAGSASQATRQPLTLYGEPAEMIEYVANREGSRDVFTVHRQRLYRLSFTPSVAAFPRASSDVEFLYFVVTSSFTFLSGHSPETGSVRFYLILPDDAGRSGPAVGCGDSAVAVESDRLATGLAAGDVLVALEKLFSIKTMTYGDLAYAHSLYDTDVTVRNVIFSSAGTLDVYLDGSFPLIGTCADARMEAQILLTVFQHPGLERAMITVNGQNMKKMFDLSGTVGPSDPYTRTDRQW